MLPTGPGRRGRLTIHRRTIAAELLAAFFFLALAAVATRPLALHVARQTLDTGDPPVDLWTIDWLTEHFFEPGQIFQGNIFHPAPHAVLYSDLSLGAAVLVLPLRLLVHDPVPLYNAAVLLALAFGGWAFHALARGLTGSRSAGVLAGVLAAFGSHQLSHIYHVNLLSIGWLALLLLGLHRMLRAPKPGPVILAGVSFALAAQTSGYYAVAAALLALFFAVTNARKLRERRVLVAAAAAAGLAALLTVPYALAYTSLGLRRPAGMSVQMAFRPDRDLTSYGYLYRTWLGSGGERLFPGLLSLALAGVALLKRRPHALFYAIAALLLVIVSLGPEMPLGGARLSLPYGWLFALPPLDGMRHPYTFAAVATFLLAILAGLGFASLGVARRPWASALVVAAAVAETLAPAPGVRAVPPGLPPAYERLATLPPGPVLELPVFAEEALVWAARHGRPVLNGQGSAFVPADTLRLNRLIDNHWLVSTPEDVDASKPTLFLLERFPVRYVILPTGRHEGYAALADAFDRSRAFALVARTEDGDRIYEVRRDASANRGQERK